MSAVENDKDKFERRAFPRISAKCEVHYFSASGGTWSQAVLKNYSDGGLCFHCDETLPQDTKVTIQIMKNASATVPAMAASAIIVRCESDNDHSYTIACQFSQVRNENQNKFDYLRR